MISIYGSFKWWQIIPSFDVSRSWGCKDKVTDLWYIHFNVYLLGYTFTWYKSVSYNIWKRW